MEKNKFSVIAHRNHEICNPISKDKLMGILEKIPFKEEMNVLDIGAGKCEVLIELIDRYGVSGTAIEIEEDFISDAKRHAEQRVNSDRLTIVNDDAKKVIGRYQGTFDATICLGATHAIGDYRSTLEHMSRVMKPGGYLLIGEGYWKKQPDPAYLDALGAEEDELLTHSENIKAAEEQGLIPMWANVTNEDEWDTYEWLYSSSMEKYCMEHPEDSDVDWMIDRIRKWRSTYLRWGRDTLGFGLYLFYKK